MAQIKTNFFANLIYLLFFTITFTGQIFITSDIIRNLLVVCCGFIAFLFTFIKKKKDCYIVIFFVFVFSLLEILSMLYNGNSSFLEIIWIFTYSGIGILIYNFKISYKISKIILCIPFLYFLICIILNKDPNLILHGGSRNIISVFLILYESIYYFLRYKQIKNIDILPAFLSLIFCIWASGRAGIISSFFIFIVVLLTVLFQNKKNRLKKILLVIFIFFILVFILRNYLDFYNLTILERFKREGLKSSRSILIEEYFLGITSNFFDFLFGVPFVNYKFLNFYKNPHNSFLMLHSKYGLFGFLLVVYLLIKLFFSKLKKLYLFELFLGISIIFRALLDWVAFPGMFDILFWISFLEVLNKKNNKKFKE